MQRHMWISNDSFDVLVQRINLEKHNPRVAFTGDNSTLASKGTTLGLGVTAPKRPMPRLPFKKNKDKDDGRDDRSRHSDDRDDDRGYRYRDDDRAYRRDRDDRDDDRSYRRDRDDRDDERSYRRDRDRDDVRRDRDDRVSDKGYRDERESRRDKPPPMPTRQPLPVSALSALSLKSRVVAIADYNSEESTDLNFSKGDEIEI
ncbi:hypothetical protein HK096_010107, partial [Nowakowskiella sp. JEL0078]